MQFVLYVLSIVLIIEIFLFGIILKITSRVEQTNRLVVSSLLEQNRHLTGCIQEVQVELLNLNRELSLLAIENKNLNIEVETLTSEVSRLQQQISNTKDL